MERAQGECLEPLKFMRSVPTQEEFAPFPQLDSLWHYECVVSPKFPSNPASPRSPALQSPPEAISPRSPGRVSPTSHSISALLPPASAIIPRSSPPLSPRSSASSSSAAPSPLSRFAPAQQALAQRVFSTFDENGDGSVSAQEISRIFEKLGLSRCEDSLHSLRADIPNLGEGLRMDEEEFLLLCGSACLEQQLDANASSSTVDADEDQDLLAAFHVFDKDGNGFISPEELQSVLCSLGFPQGRQLQACVDMIARVDENNDGQVDFFEFKKLFHMENPFITTIQTF